MVVPFGGGPGITEFWLNAQDHCAGRPEQFSVNVRFEPGAAYIASGTMRLCPAFTLCAVTGANPAIATVSFTVAEVLPAKFASPLY
jgi:hypothetical protein